MRISLKNSFYDVVLSDEEIVEGELPKPTHELREMSAAQRDKYLDEFKERMIVDKAGVLIGVKSFDGLQAALLARTLFRKSDNKTVSAAEIQGWPAGAVTQLYRKAQELNRLGADEEEKAKNA